MRLPRELQRWLNFRFGRASRDAPPTFFFHIPKCAGSSVWASLYDIYGTRHIYHANTRRRLKRFEGLSRDARLAYSAVGGHAPLKFFREQLGEMGRYHKIVTLRDPVDRAISEYNYIRTQASHPRNQELSPKTLREFAEESLRPDRQVTLLTGRGDDVEGAVEIVTRFFDDWAFSDGVSGLVQRLYRATGVEPRPTAHKNKGAPGTRRADLDAPTLRLLQERNRNDLALIAALKERRTQ